MASPIALSIVVPIFNGEETIGKLVHELSSLRIPGGFEIVLVNDGSRDGSREICKHLVETSAIPATLVDLSRNFGEHNAVICGLRFARGDFIITMDDDLQNPPFEIPRLYDYIRERGADVVYTYFDRKEHSGWRNFGSWLANTTANFVLDKPSDLYLSTFRCMTRFMAEQIIQCAGPYPFLDGFVFQMTNRVERLEVAHLPRAKGKSQYTLRKLLRLWVSILVNFSVLPLRLSTYLGLSIGLLGFFGTAYVVVEYFIRGIDVPGWASLMVVALMFSGVQLLIIGLLGEYVGRIYLTLTGMPQSVVREVIRPVGKGQDDAFSLDAGKSGRA